MESLGGLLFPLLILLLFIPIFLSGRKQRRQAQDMQQLQGSLENGDVVTTTSGLRGTVVDASYQDTIDLEIADGVVTTWLRAAVRDKVLDSGPVDGGPVDGGPVDGDTMDGDTDALAPEVVPSDAVTAGTEPTVADRPTGTTTGVTPNGTGPARRADVVADPADTPTDANGSHRP
jgi:preprotein translocase subunit YajC